MEPSDYYRPPKAELGAAETPAAAGTGRVYSIRQITAATFLGTPLAGAILMAGNATAFGEAQRRRSYLIGGAVATVLVFVVALLLPDRFPNSVLPLAYTLALQAVATRLQGANVQAQLTAGSRHHSNWRVLGVGVACLAATILVLLVLAVAYGLLADQA
jgi:hypothetical protein